MERILVDNFQPANRMFETELGRNGYFQFFL